MADPTELITPRHSDGSDLDASTLDGRLPLADLADPAPPGSASWADADNEGMGGNQR